MSSPFPGSDDPRTSTPDQQHSLPNPATLLEYFIAAKRSLASSTLVYEARESVVQVRAVIQELAVLSARNQFCSEFVRHQIQVTTVFRDTLETSRKRKKAKFRETLGHLDAADRALNRTLQRLSSTKVNFLTPSSDSKTRKRVSELASDGPRTLLDYTNQTAWDDLRNLIRQSIDNVNAAEDQVVQIEDRLDHWIKDIGDALDYRDPQRLKLPNVELATAFLELETHEHDAAVSLQSLIKHYDLCVKALRHTEGAGDAIAGGVEAHEHPLNASGSDEEVPMSADERVELVQVIQNDAKEVDAVVTEINDLSEAIQDKADRIEESAASHRSEASTLGGTARMLEALGVDLSKASQQSQSAFSTWAAELEVLQRRLPEMQAIDASFKKTLNAYGGLQRHLTKRRERRAQIEQLFADDEEEHRRWASESKDALPSLLVQAFDDHLASDDALRLPQFIKS